MTVSCYIRTLHLFLDLFMLKLGLGMVKIYEAAR